MYLREKYENWREKDIAFVEQRKEMEKHGITLDEPGRVRKDSSSPARKKKFRIHRGISKSPNTRLSTPREHDELTFDHIENKKRGS